MVNIGLDHLALAPLPRSPKEQPNQSSFSRLLVDMFCWEKVSSVRGTRPFRMSIRTPSAERLRCQDLHSEPTNSDVSQRVLGRNFPRFRFSFQLIVISMCPPQHFVKLIDFDVPQRCEYVKRLGQYSCAKNGLSPTETKQCVKLIEQIPALGLLMTRRIHPGRPLASPSPPFALAQHLPQHTQPYSAAARTLQLTSSTRSL